MKKLVLLAVPLLLPTAPAAAPRQDGAPDDVRLVVMVCVDQLIPEQLERLEPWLTGGLGRFTREGRSFARAEFHHAETVTGAGHAVFGTGCNPARNGVVGNEWRDRASGAEVYCVADPNAVLMAGPEGEPQEGRAGSSPANLLVPGLPDRLRERDAGSQSISIAGKDRSAVLMGGRHPDWALWWNGREGGFASSTWYGDRLPEWVRAWNATWVERVLAGGEQYVWTDDFHESALAGSDADVRPGEPRSEAAFPHASPSVSAERAPKELSRLAGFVRASPAGDAAVISLADAAVERLGLGADESVDFLALGLSSCDVVGHTWGPYSQEIGDLLVRTDAELGAFFERLDERVGKGRWIAVLSADHGVLELPERLVERGFPARRVSGMDLMKALQSIYTAFTERYGEDTLRTPSPSGLLFDAERLAAGGHDVAEARRWAAELALEKADFLAAAYTYDELREAAADEHVEGLLALAANNFHPDRSLDVVFVARPWHLIGMGYGTSHGSPYDYDRHVPLVFLGPGFVHGRSFEPASPLDAVPTLMQRLGLPSDPDIDGHVLGTGDRHEGVERFSQGR